MIYTCFVCLFVVFFSIYALTVWSVSQPLSEWSLACFFYFFPFAFLFTIVANVACAFFCCSIIGLYVSMVFVIGRFARLFVSEVSYRIMFMELPYIDKILKLCLDIYLVRECCDFRLEEDLFAKLIFLYRSPETMVRWTKMKRE